MTFNLDLIVLVPDADIDWTIRTLLEERQEALGIRSVQFKIIRHQMRDNGVFNDAPAILRPYLNQARYALVMFDREGSGQEHRLSAPEMEADVEARLRQNGWNERVCAVVLDPELEVWVWSSSPHVAQVLGVSTEALRDVKNNFSLAENGKPERPKEAMQAALHRSGRPFSASIFRELAEKVSLRPSERAFDKFRDTMQRWFPAENSQ